MTGPRPRASAVAESPSSHHPSAVPIGVDRPSSERRAWNRRAGVIAAAALALTAVFLFAHLGSYPIVLWDESRVAVNALEMYERHPSLVTTYDFKPDLWNTKPPLLIWLMTASMTMFGPSEWSVRVPSALAAMATVALTMIFVWRLTRSVAATVLACAALVGSRAFHGRHVAATGDYDALLTLCTTAYLVLLFFSLHRRLPARRWVLGAGVAVAAAILTKGVAGVIPLAGVALYVVLVRRWARPFLTWRYALAAAIVIAAAGGFYFFRELAAPGYIRAVLANEVGGRYLATIGGHTAPVTYFAKAIARSEFSGGLLLLLVPFGAIVATARVRLGILFATCAATGVVLVFSVSATKLPWYIAPAFPFLSVAFALAVFALARSLVRTTWRSNVRLHSEAIVLVVAAAVVGIAAYRYEPITREPVTSQAYYGLMFEALHGRGIREVDVVEGGDFNAEGFVGYAPRLRFYQLLWERRAFRVRTVARDLSGLDRQPQTVNVTCDERVTDQLRRRGEPVVAVGGCVSIQNVMK